MKPKIREKMCDIDVETRAHLIFSNIILQKNWCITVNNQHLQVISTKPKRATMDHPRECTSNHLYYDT